MEMSGFFDFSQDHLPSALLAFIPGVINLAILSYGIFRLPRTRLTTVFNLFVLVLICWQLADTAYRLSATEEVAGVWDKVFCIGYMAVGPLALHFALHVAGPARIADSRLALSLLYLPYVFFTLTYLATPVDLAFTHRGFWGFVNPSRPGTIDEVERYWTSVLGLMALFVLFRKAFLVKSKEKRTQLLLIACGLSIPALQGILTEVVFPVFLARPEVPLTASTMTFFSLAAILVLNKYKMFSVTESIPVETVMENLTSFVFIVSPRRKVIYVNTHAAAVFGIDPDLPHDFSFDTLFVTGSDEDIIGDSLKGNCIKDSEFDLWVRGKQVSFQVSTRQIVNNGVLQGILVAARDNTEQKAAARELVRSEKKYKKLFENNPQPMWIFDKKTLAFLDVNHAAILHYGYSREEFLSMTLMDIRPAEDVPHLLDVVGKITTKQNKSEGIRHRKKNGEIILVDIASHQVDYDSVDARFVLINDITERKKAEEKILASEELLAKTQQVTHIGSWECNTSTGIVYWSDELYRIYGMQPQERNITLDDFFKLTHPEDREVAEAVISQVLEDYQPYSFYYRVVRKDGEVRTIHGQGEVTCDSQARALILRGVAKDVTEQKHAEEKLEQQNAELLKANAELDRFVYSASHELRAPLSSILGLINISRMQNCDPEQMRIVDMMQASIHRLDTFIKSIADYSRNTRLELEQEKIDFRQMIGESVTLLLYMEEKDKIRMIVDVEGEGDFYSDKRRLEVVLNNFLSNAIKYHNTRQEDPFIRIRVRYDENSASLEVTDNGTGIPEKYLDKIFNIFYRATAAKSGSGLGLYIVKEIVNRMSGTIHVDSGEGAGTTFTVRIPNMKKVTPVAETGKVAVEAAR